MAAPAPLRLPATVQQHLYDSASATAQALARAVAAQLQEGIRQHGRATLIVSGGRTPAPFQDALSAQALEWPRVSVTLADDRWVPPDHADSNERLVQQHLLRGPAAAAHFIPLVDTDVTPKQRLSAVERLLAPLPAPYDAVVLGMGEDGHTASLFPGAPGTAAAMDLQRPERVAIVTPATAPHRRISLTLRALLDARVVTILLQGESKRAAIEWAAQGQPEQYPIAAVLRQTQVPVHLYYSP